MTLRSRLLLVLVGLVAAGLVITDVVTYTQLRSFLLERIDPQLEAAYFPASYELATVDHLSVPREHDYASHRPGGVAPGAYGVRAHFGGSSLAATGAARGAPGPALDEVAELVDADGRVYDKPLPSYDGRGQMVPPKLPHPLPAAGSQGYAIFDAASTGPGAVTYRVLARPLGTHHLTVVVAIPLTDVTQTMGRLLWIEILVSVVVLAGLGVLAWWIVRRGLRPLEDMAVTAGAIAEGRLGLRVAPADEQTEVGRLGLALNAMLGEIEQAFASRAASEERLRRFLADASHELRTPLTSIRGYSEIFDLGASRNPDDLATSMHHIRDEAKRMNLLVDDLLLLARLDQQRPLDLAPVDLAPVLQKAVAAVGVLAPGHVVTVEVPERLVVDCDPERIRQVVDNLLGNAVRHSPPGAPVSLGALRQGDEVLLEVGDHGPGVAPQDAERIFEPFYRADFARARTTGGAGLGLAIVAAIVHAHGGAVGVRPNEGGGACFWVRLPAGPSEALPGDHGSAGSSDRSGAPSAGPGAATPLVNAGGRNRA